MQTTAFDPGRYPRTYRHWIVYRLVVAPFSMLLGIGIVGLTITTPGTSPIHWGVTLPCAAAAMLFAVHAWRHRVLLAPTFLETRGLRTRRVPRDQITGFRRRPVPQGSAIYLVSSRGRPRPMAIRSLGDDPDFRAWFAGLVDTDAIERGRAKVEIAVDARLGATPQLRLAAAARARRAATWLTVAAWLTTAWTLLDPRPGSELLWLDAAWVPFVLVVCALSDGRFTLTRPRNSQRADLVGVVVASLFALGSRAWNDIILVSYWPLVLPSIAAGGALALLAFVACRNSPRATGAPLFNGILLGLHAAAAMTLANVAYDSGPAASQLAAIVHMRKTSGRHSSTYLTLSAVPADLDSTEIEVPRAFYRGHKTGDLLCIGEREGAFGWHWIQLRSGSGPCGAR